MTLSSFGRRIEKRTREYARSNGGSARTIRRDRVAPVHLGRLEARWRLREAGAQRLERPTWTRRGWLGSAGGAHGESQ